MMVGIHEPTWNFEIISRSKMMLAATLIVAMKSGTSGLSSARVQFDTATCMADESAEIDEICTYLIDASRTCAGTNAAARRSEDATKITVMMAPSIV